MSTNLAVQKQVVGPEEIKILKDAFFKGFTDVEVNYCVAVANQLNLSPILRQIHFVKRVDKNGKSTITSQTGIDGLRLAAQRTGEYAGSDDPIFEYAEDRKTLIKATVTIYRLVGGTRCAFTASARWDEFYPGGNQAFMWNKMPHVMLGKCAEAQALRKGFPAELSSLYSNEEMDQADKARVIQSVIDEEPKKDVVGIVEEKKPLYKCELCGEALRLSKAGTSYYCPNFEDKGKGFHTKIAVTGNKREMAN